MMNNPVMREQASAAPRVEVYHKTWCPYSRAALALLDRKGVAYEDIDVTTDRGRERKMIERSGRTSMPQIFIGGEPIGCYDELKALHARGGLEKSLGLGVEERRKAA